ncbi:MAG: LacI family DNA-binding transcriptional regulator [Thiolinea sp.]
MTERITMRDVAVKAGVGIATVDRVLNGRRKVREENAQRVYQAAIELGYYAAPVIQYRLQEAAPTATFGFVLPKGQQPFYQNLSSKLQQEVERCTAIRGKVVIRYAKTQLSGEFAELLTDMRGQADIVAASAVDHPTVTMAVEQLAAAGIATFSLLNDFASPVRHSFVGLDNMKIGRTAGWMLANSLREPGNVSILMGSHLWQGHQLRELGFRSYLREYAPELQLSDAVLNLETSQITYEMMADLLATTPDLRGIYITGGGMEGAIRALREMREPGEVRLIVHPYNQESRQALAERYVSMIIGTPLQELCRWLIGRMTDTLLDKQTTLQGQHFLHPQIFLPESGRYD